MDLVRMDELYPIEEYVEWLLPVVRKNVIKNGYWLDAVRIEKKNNLILDGHHRFEIGKRLNFRCIPVVRFDYDDVVMWSLREEYVISKEDVCRNAIKGILYPYKTVKHRFPSGGGICECKIKLEELKWK